GAPFGCVEPDDPACWPWSRPPSWTARAASVLFRTDIRGLVLVIQAVLDAVSVYEHSVHQRMYRPSAAKPSRYRSPRRRPRRGAVHQRHLRWLPALTGGG